MIWHLMRHGEINSNINGTYAGWNDEGLTPNGKQQVKDASKELANRKIDAIFCSPQKRAVQTAEILSDALGVKYITRDSFRELKLGRWEGKSEELIRKLYVNEWDIWNTRPAELIVEGRETLGELMDRVLRGIREVKGAFRFVCPLIVTHVSVVRALILYSKKMDLNLYRTILVPNAKLFEVPDMLLEGRTL
ncbi:putative Phosphoserine phosphatase 1 [uncultured Desulfobacterium sp.]|uniref:Putative Phosphoserine phosphatase 1 n=1 Tax=uncultured Desulfobacterium sp. TaxID=201089 RepID=A0A445N3Y6_9BACT|nr:putative Phosphoserine phosphatase 1 [uncultured Desulfobacterium sp.]